MGTKVKIIKNPSFNDINVQDAYNSVHNVSPSVTVNKTLKPTDKEHATLEAEKGETVVTNIQDEGIPEFYTISGKPHYKGGTPLNLPPNSFIFSKNKDLKIKNPDILAKFGKTGKKATKKYSPAELSKAYDLNTFREILANPFSDTLQKDTAEQMIKNYNLKLGALALVQESIKGFDRGIPAIALSYMEDVGIQPEDLIAPPQSQEAPLQQFKKGGENNNKRKVKITQLPKFAKAGETPSKKKTPIFEKGYNKWDPSKDDFKWEYVQPGDYFYIDGKWKRFKGNVKSKFEGELFDDPALGTFQEDFSRLNQKFQDPEVRAAVVNKYRETMKNVKPRKGLTQEMIDAAANLKDDEIIENMLYKTRSNMAYNNKFGDLSETDKKDLWDKDRTYAENAMKELGYEPLDRVHTLAFQHAYNTIDDMMKDPEDKKIFKDFKLMQAGLSDETKGSISDDDGWDGNTTSGQVMLTKDTIPDYEDIEYKDVPEEADVKHLNDTTLSTPARFWTQDKVNMGLALHDRLTAKKYNPWMAPLDYVEAEPTFTDFRGSAARIGAHGAGLADAASTFAGPQSLAAFNVGIQKNMIDGILQTQEFENRANVGVANQFAQANAGRKTQFNIADANNKTQLYDKQTIANQQFDNTKRALKHNIWSAFNNAWTNRGKAQTTNKIHPDFNVDPRTGFTYRTGYAPDIIPDNYAQTKKPSEEIAEYMHNNSGVSWEAAVKAIKLDKGITDDSLPQGVDPRAFMYPG